jgi:retinol dehydrogenase 12
MFDATRGARTTLHLALAPDLDGINGNYFDEHAAPKVASEIARNVALQDALWQRSLEWTG